MHLSIIPYRRLWFSISSVFCAISLVLILTLGFNLGIDFTGGSEVEYQFDNGVNQEELLSIVAPFAEQKWTRYPRNSIYWI